MTHILLVEDDDLLAEGLEFALTKESYTVDRAPSVADAERKLSARDYDLVLLDVMLPDGTGFGLCRSIRSRSGVPVLFLTACDEEVNVVQGLEMGGDDYITKPFRLRELISRIKAILRRTASAGAHEASTVPPAAGGHGGHDRPQRQEAGTFTAAGITVRTLETKAYKHGTELVLTPVEYRLLALFLQNQGNTLTRTRLLDRLWDEQGEFVDDNTLSVHIRRLREKIEDDPSHPARIITVRGVGYRFEAGGAAPHE